AYQAHQEGLSLIAHRVAGGNTVCAGGARDAQKEMVTNLTRRLFNAAPRLFSSSAHVSAFNRHRQAQAVSESPHELGVFVGIRAAQLMVEMRDVNREEW